MELYFPGWWRLICWKLFSKRNDWALINIPILVCRTVPKYVNLIIVTMVEYMFGSIGETLIIFSTKSQINH